jgi:3',5'-cyclic AMP phosphodiesterase CpdA
MLVLSLALAFTQSPFAPLNHKPLPPSKTDFYFVALGDNRPAGAGLPPTATYRELLKEVSILGPEFVISTGDLLYGNEDTLDQYKQEIAWIKPLLETLPCPFFNVPGNHEINNRPEFLAEYQKRLGPLYGKFEFGGYRFVAVCTEIPSPHPSVFGDQLDWLKQEFSVSKPTFTYQHHPVFERPTNKDTAEQAEVENAGELHKLYQQGGVKIAFEGHDHVYNKQEHDGITYVIAGGSGAPLDAAPTDGGYFHFVLVHVNGDSVTETPIPMGAIEIVPMGDGVVAAGEYADAELPVTNLHVMSREEPKGLTAGYQAKTGKIKSVDATIVRTTKTADGYDTQVSLVLPAHHATIVRLTF